MTAKHTTRKADAKETSADTLAAEADGIASTANPLKVPFAVATQEAASVAAFVITYWEPTADVPGLVQVAARLPKSTSDDIVTLIQLVQQSQTGLLLIVDPPLAQHGAEAHDLIETLESAIAFTLDDGVEDADDQKLEQIRQEHADDGTRSSEVAQELRDYAALAASLGKRITDVDAGFDPKTIDAANALAAVLMQAPVDAAKANGAAAQQARATRNRRLTLLTQKVALVRKTAAHVFLKQPAIVRESTSAYDRKRRAAARRARAAQAATAEKAPAKP